MIKKLPPFKGLKMRIPIITPRKGRKFINHGCGLGLTLSIEGFIFEGICARRPYYIQFLDDVDAKVRVWVWVSG